MTDSEQNPDDLLVVVLDTSLNRRKFPNARGVWADYAITKGHSIYVVDENGEEQLIPNGTVVYAGPMSCEEIPSFGDLEEQHELEFVSGSTMWGNDE